MPYIVLLTSQGSANDSFCVYVFNSNVLRKSNEYIMKIFKSLVDFFSCYFCLTHQTIWQSHFSKNPKNINQNNFIWNCLVWKKKQHLKKFKKIVPLLLRKHRFSMVICYHQLIQNGYVRESKHALLWKLTSTASNQHLLLASLVCSPYTSTGLKLSKLGISDFHVLSCSSRLFFPSQEYVQQEELLVKLILHTIYHRLFSLNLLQVKCFLVLIIFCFAKSSWLQCRAI